MRLIWRWRGVLEGEWAEASGWLCCTWGHLSRSDSISHLAPPHDARSCKMKLHGSESDSEAAVSSPATDSPDI